MLFNSIEFVIFLPAVFILYWFVLHKNRTIQNILIICASYVFYGWWDWRFLSLIIISSTVDYIVGINLTKFDNKKVKKTLLLISIFVNIGILGFFKYFNFFVDSFIQIFSTLGLDLHTRTLNIILPVGISFYTFQTLSYTIDVYRNKLKPTDDVFAFFAFVSFFPQLVAGPIERAKSLLPQFYESRVFNYEQAVDGGRQILWGLVKKVVIADTIAGSVDYIFGNYSNMSGSSLFIGVVLFAFQIYGDFSGYSDIAIGTARLFGFNLSKNFAFPYFSRNISEFWRRWHISLSTWFRDYVYIPLGGSFCSKRRQSFNIITTFTISGLWHGANWTFVFWGFLNGLYYIPLMFLNKKQNYEKIVAKGKLFPNIHETFAIATTFILTLLAWVFFRSDTIMDAFGYLGNMMSLDLFSLPSAGRQDLIILIPFIIYEWVQRNKEHGLDINFLNPLMRKITYSLIIIMIIFFAKGQQSFIYFQF